MKVTKLIITAILLLLVLRLGLVLVSSRSFQFFGGIVHRVKTQERMVALTFDDGPTDQTEQVLEVLEELGVKATFFVTGKDLSEHKAAGKMLVEAGHELGNHSYSHQRMVLKSPAFVRQELERTDHLIREVGYNGAIHFRPPNAKKFLVLPYVLARQDRKTIMWDIEPDSYPNIAQDATKMVEHVVENVRPGSIILLHVMCPSRRESLKAVTGIVETLRQQGYSFVTVSELLAHN